MTRARGAVRAALPGRGDRIALGVLAVAFVVYHWEIIFGTRLISAADLVFALYSPWTMSAPNGVTAHNAAMADSVVSMAPAMSFVRESLWNGQLPLWNPYTEFGNPFWAQSQWGILSPVQLPFLAPPRLYGVETAQTLTSMLKVLVGLLGTYALCRRLRLRPASALLAAIALGFGGYLTAWLSMPATSTAVFIPWALLALDLTLFSRRPLLSAGGLAFALAAMVAGGHPEVLLNSCYVLGVFGLTRAIQNRRLLKGQVRRRAGAIAIGIAFSAGLSAALLLPAAELFSRSIDSEQRSEIAAHPIGWDALRYVLEPDRDGSPIRGNPRVGIDYAVFAAPWFAGVVSGVLALVGILLRDRRALPFALIALLSVAIALDSPPYEALADTVPVLGAVTRAHALLLWAIALPFLAGVGADALDRALRRGIAFNVEVFSRGREKVRVIAVPVAAVLGFVLFLELFTWGVDYNPRIPRNQVAVPMPGAMADLPAGPVQGRTVFLGEAVRPLLPMGFKRPEVRGYGQPTRKDYDQFIDAIGTLPPAYGSARYGSYVGYRLDKLAPNALNVLSASNVAFAADTGGKWPLAPRFQPLRDHAGGVLALGPIAYWRLDDPGDRVTDAGPNGLHGRYRRRGTHVDGALTDRRGNSARDRALLILNGRGTAELPPLPLARRSFSIAAWIRPDIPTGQESCVFAAGEPGKKRHALHLCVNRGTFSGRARRPSDLWLRFGFWFDGLDSAPGALKPGDWAYVVATYDAERKRAKLFVDGKKVGENRSGPFLGPEQRVSLGEFSAGRAPFDGAIEEVAVFDRALTSPDLRQQLEAGTLQTSVNPTVEHRAFTASHFVVEPTVEGAVRRLRQPGFDPAKTVVLDRAPRGLRPGRPGERPSKQPPVITQYENQRVTVKADMERPGLLVLSDSIYPGWKAEVDGRSVPITRANGLFRAVALPAGTHEVRFVYASTTVRAGVTISLLSLIGLVAFIWWARRREHVPAPR